MITAAGVALALVLAVLVQTVTGSGFGVVAAPVLVMLRPDLVPGPLLLLTVVVMLGEVWRGRRHLSVRWMGWPLIGYVSGALLGIWLLGLLSAPASAVGVAVVLLGAVTCAWLGWRPAPTANALRLPGFASGVSGIVAGLPGPPIVIVRSEGALVRLRTELAAYFAVTAALSVGLLGWGGQLAISDAVGTVRWLPALVGGAWLGTHVLHRVDDAWVRPVTLGISFFGSVALLVRIVA